MRRKNRAKASTPGYWSFAGVDDLDEGRRSLMSGPPPAEPPPPEESWLKNVQFKSIHFPQGPEARAHRRGFGYVHYLDFDLAQEVRLICGPLATEVAEVHSMPTLLRERTTYVLDKPVPGPYPLHRYVEVLAKEVHQVRRRTTEWLARRVDAAGRQRLAAVVADSAHGRCPEVREEDLRTGLWLGDLVGHVSPLSADLAAVMAAMPTPGPHGCTYVDEFIVDVLRSLEIEAGILRRRIPEVRAQQVMVHKSRARAERDPDASRVSADLRRIGIR